MKKINILLLLFLLGCSVSHYAQQKEDFDKTKPSFWKYNETKKTYSTPVNMQEVIFWTKYKDYLTGKDTTFILREFGIPNLKGNNKRSYKYFTSSDCEYAFYINGKYKSNFNCEYINFEFDEKYKIKRIFVDYSIAIAK
jgi:hypothetical protein